jgi:hypothetical protein
MKSAFLCCGFARKVQRLILHYGFRCVTLLVLVYSISQVLAADPDYFPPEFTNSPSADPQELLRQIEILRTRYRDSHPELVDLQRRFDAAKKRQRIEAIAPTVETGQAPPPIVTPSAAKQESASTARSSRGSKDRQKSQLNRTSELTLPPGRQRNPRLLDLVSNKWIKLHQADGNWRRSAHAGSAYDLRRGQLLVFGSDTHGSNWDNAVHAYDPFEEHWTHSYPPAPKLSYRKDERGVNIAGEIERQPWAMHSFDAIVYDPSNDTLIVMGIPAHNPIRKKVRGGYDPTWVYDLESNIWRDRLLPKGKQPRVFAGASAYDSNRDVIVAYPGGSGGGIWELGIDRAKWRKVAGSHHKIHHNMVFAPDLGLFVVFGDFKGTSEIWAYAPASRPGIRGTWQKRNPAGNCPALESAPAAYDPQNRLFLVIAKKIYTCVYDYRTNQLTRLNVNTPNVGKMNYMMQYDPYHGVFLLVTGDWRAPPEIWGFRLDPNSLPPVPLRQPTPQN